MDKKVSVLIITNNHEKYIAQAVESALQQEVDFQYEIVIGDDCSADHTREILRELSKAHPERIRLLLREKKAAGLPGKSNFVETLKACQGQYVALLDGDDYWTDAHKLQKQVNFLESHPECAICFHDVTLFYEDGSPAGRSSCTTKKEIFTIEDLLAGNFMFACSVVFRRGLFGDFPDWFYSSMMGDWILHIINAQYGKVGYLNEAMAVYRVHQGGFWTSLNVLDQAKDNTRIVDHLVNYLDDKYRRQAKAAKAKSYQYLSEVYYQQGDMANARSSLLKSLRICLSNKSIPDRRLVGRLIKLQTFSSYEWLRLRFMRT